MCHVNWKPRPVSRIHVENKGARALVFDERMCEQWRLGPLSPMDTEEMGVIQHIRSITERAGKTIRMLRVGYDAGFLLMTTEDVSSRPL